MKQIDVLLTELTKEETLKVEPQQILIYNKLTGTYSLEYNTDKNYIGKNKYASDKLIYFSFKGIDELWQ